MTVRPGLAIVPLVIAGALAPFAIAAADDAPAPVAGVVSAAGDDGPLFFGPAGQIYAPAQKPDTWRRRALGGVAADIAGVVRTSSGTLFAAGGGTPLFRREGTLWYAHPLPNRGPLALSRGGGAVVLAVGRHVYHLRADEWRRKGRAPRGIEAIWAGASGRMYVATEGPKIFRKDGRRFTKVRHPLSEDDAIAGLVGRPGHELYAIADSGAVLQVSPARAREARIPAPLEGLRIDAIGYLPDGTPALAGVVGSAEPDGEGGEAPEGEPARAALVALKGSALHLEAWIPPVPPGDRIAAIAARGEAAVVATRRGLVAIRDGEGWREGRVSAELPEGAEPRAEGAPPARSR